MAQRKRSSRRDPEGGEQGDGAKRRRVPRWARWVVRVLVVLPLVLFVLVLVLARSPLVKRVAADQVERLFGAEFQADAAYLSPNGTLVIEGLRLRVPGMDGEHAELLRDTRTEVDLDFGGVLAGEVRPTAVRLSEPVFRLAIERDTGELNIDAIVGPAGGSGSGPGPRVDVLEARVEFGEYVGSTYTALNELNVTGSLTPLSGSDGYAIQFNEIAPAGGVTGRERGPVVLTGSIDLKADRTELALRNVAMEAFPASAMPTAIRDRWEQLALQGRVVRATLLSTPQDPLGVSFEIEGVAMDTPLPADPLSNEPEGTYLSLADVSGKLDFSQSGLIADVRGRIEDLPARVRIMTEGLALDAPFEALISAEPFPIRDEPDLLPFAPEVVRERFRDFSGPTARITEAEVLVKRNGPGDPLVTGFIAFEDGEAAYEAFPYPIKDLRGVVRFDPDRIRISNVSGRGPSGALLQASGLIAPPNSIAGVDLEITAVDVRLDEYLEGALPEGRRRVLDILFSKEDHAELLEAGLAIDPRERRASNDRVTSLRLEKSRLLGREGVGDRILEIDAEVAELEDALALPTFPFRGSARIDIDLNRAVGEVSNWTNIVTVSFDRVGLLPEAFPYPILARDVRLEITDTEARLLSGSFEGLVGGVATLEAGVALETPDGTSVFSPHLRVLASGVPVDDLLIHALPQTRRDEADGVRSPDQISAKRVLRELNITGEVTCEATVTTRPREPDQADEGASDPEIVFDVTVDFDGIVARPRTERLGSGLRLDNVQGTVHATSDHLSLAGLTADVVDVRTPGEPRPIGDVWLDLEADLVTDDAEGGTTVDRFSASVAAADLRLDAPIEELAALASSEAASELTRLRVTHSPRGIVDLVVDIDSGRGSPLRASALVSGVRDASAWVGATLFGIGDTDGIAYIDVTEPRSVRFEEAAADLRVQGEPCGRVRLHGVGVGGRATDAAGAHTSALQIALDGSSFESSLVAQLLERLASDRLRGLIARAAPRGAFDAEATVLTPGLPLAPDDEASGDALAGVGLEVLIRPSSLSIDRGALGGAAGGAEQRIEATLVEGGVRFDQDLSGELESLRLEGETWWVAADGTWGGDGGGTTPCGFDVSFGAQGLDEEVRGLLGPTLMARLDEIGLTIDGGLGLSNGRASFDLVTDAEDGGGGGIELGAAQFDGDIEFNGLGLDALGATDASGVVGASLRRTGPDGAWVGALDIGVGRLRLGGVGIDDLRARVLNTPDEPERLLIPQVSASVHNGRAYASGVVYPGETNDQRRYRLSLDLAGVPLTRVLTEVDEAEAHQDDEAAGPSEAVAALAGRFEDESAAPRGVVDARLSVAGVLGEPATRRGAGSVRVTDGDLLPLSIIPPLIQLASFQLPTGAPLDYMDAGFHVVGDRVELDHLIVLSDSMSILGEGRIDLSAREVDMVFTPRAPGRIPVFSDIVDAVRNELVTVKASGPIGSPVFEGATLTGARRLLGSIFGGDDGVAPALGRDALRAEREARAERARTGSGAGGNRIGQGGIVVQPDPDPAPALP